LLLHPVLHAATIAYANSAEFEGGFNGDLMSQAAFGPPELGLEGTPLPLVALQVPNLQGQHPSAF